MTLVAIVSLGLLVALATLLSPVGIAELRQGREQFRTVVVEAAVSAGIGASLQGSWVDSTVGAPPGVRIVLPPLLVRPSLEVDVVAESVGRGLWLLNAEAFAADRSGTRIAAARRGFLVRVGVSPPDTVLRAKPIRRSWVVGFE